MVFISHVSSLNIGRPAVMVFFMLSGYWISHLYDRSTTSVAYFYLDRWLRIWPLMAIISVFWVLISTYAGFEQRNSLLSTLLLIGVMLRNDSVLFILWTLDIELQFFLILPFIFFMVKKDKLHILAISSVFAFLISWYLFPETGGTVFAFAPSFVAGMALFATRWTPPLWLVVVGIVAFVLTGLLMLSSPLTYNVIIKPKPDNQLMLNINVIWTLFLVPFVAYNLNKTSSKFDRLLGDLSYPLYLVHSIVVVFIYIYLSNNIISKLIAFCVSLFVAIVVYVAIERPLERFRLGLRGGMQAPRRTAQ